MTRAWSPGAVTGVGSLPGTDPEEAARLVFGELPDLPHVPELPGRGAGADMIGRSAALLVDLPVEIVVGAWRVASHPGRDVRRARDFLAWDADAVELAGAGYTGPVKVQAVGPWTLAASLELPNGHRVVSDHGAARDLAASLAEGLAGLLADLRGRLPGADLLLQLDEPSLPAVLGGRVPTPSGYGTVRSISADVVAPALNSVLEVAEEGRRVVHCCAADVPIALFRRSGADALSLDAALIDRSHYDALGEAIDGGMALWPGVLPATDAELRYDDVVAALRRLWGELGFATGELATSVVPTPACGLAGASPDHARRAMAVLRDVGKALQDELD